MTTAVFSNGFEDVYKGNRDVKAAWCITNKKTGEVVKSGHSLDIIKAEKTARGNTSHVCGAPNVCLRPSNYANQIAYYTKVAKKEGFRNWKEMYAAQSAARSKWIQENLSIEIIKLN